MKLILALYVAIVGLAPSLLAGTQIVYDRTPLELPAGIPNGEGRDINANNLTVGFGFTQGTPDPYHTLVWDASGAILADLGTLGRDGDLAINDHGTVAGYSGSGFPTTTSFIWSADTGLQLLPTNFFPRDINNNGVVVGSLDGFFGTPAIWDATNGIQTLQGTAGAAVAINDNGLIVGSSNGRAAVWNAVTSAPTYLFEPGYTNYASAVSEAGVVAGSYGVPSGSVPFLWDSAHPEFGITSFGDSSTNSSNNVRGMNIHNELVGQTHRIMSSAKRWNFNPNYTFPYIGDTGHGRWDFRGINDMGSIICTEAHPLLGDPIPVLYTRPIPAPGAVLLLGVAAPVAVRRRR